MPDMRFMDAVRGHDGGSSDGRGCRRYVRIEMDKPLWRKRSRKKINTYVLKGYAHHEQNSDSLKQLLAKSHKKLCG